MSCDCLAVSTCKESVKLPEEGDTLSGFVKIKFRKGSGEEITVGNESAPGLQNHACIKDFEFGHSDGCTARVTIHDEQGGGFVEFTQNILQKLDDAKEEEATTMEVEYGWIKTFCDGRTEVNKTDDKYYLMARSVDCNFANGKYMFNIEGVDITEVVFETAVSKVYGTEEQKLYITDAIRQLFTDTDNKMYPTVSQVQFWKRPAPGAAPQNVKFKDFEDDPEKGPKGTGKWAANTANKFEVARNWLEPFVTQDDKALVPAYDSTVPGGRIIFWEDAKPSCSGGGDNSLLGTYVVNGGVLSNVIEFNPKIKWYFAGLTIPGGGMGNDQVTGGDPADGGRNRGLRDCFTLQRSRIPTGGTQSTNGISENASDIHGRNAGRVQEAGVQAQSKAYDIMINSIEAELVILGDPKLTKPQLCLFRNVKIIFLNPYFISGGGQGDCGEWLAQPKCNPTLTKDRWMVKSITHRIQDGKYTTTLQLYLAAPGVDIDAGAPIGGGDF